MINYKTQEPVSKKEFEEYYFFRWKILRKPIGMALDSVKDDLEDESFHLIIKNKNRKIIAVGRMHFINRKNKDSAQIRYMAVDDKYKRIGLGSKILKSFENKAMDHKMKKMILHARENALDFYIKNGYKIKHKSHLLSNKIQHWLMYKNL